MPHIKKLVMKGFKSFPVETEILFDKAMNVIVGPNGSGKSNISDAICFVLGRLSIKSIRAAKAAHLIFAGTKAHKSMGEASVEIVFDNTDKKFFLPELEVKIKRIVRSTGQSIYKINNETKTRQEVLELLAQGGIDPHGFNIVLQGEIANFVKMSGEDRRKIIEEIAGIAVYEVRKEKSLHELEKTEEKLKEISAILRERTAYLKNLDQERQQALRFKQLELTAKKCKASILNKKIEEKKKSLSKVNAEIETKEKAKEKQKQNIEKTQKQIQELEEKINEIGLYVQKATGLQQEKLHAEISDLRAELAGLTVRKDNSENRISEIEKRKQELQNSISQYEKDINDLREKSPILEKKQQQLEEKRKAFENIEEEKRKFYSLKSELNTIKARLDDRKKQLQRAKASQELILQQIEQISTGLENETSNSLNKKLNDLKDDFENSEKKLKDFESKNFKLEKQESVKNAEIEKLEKLKKDILKLDICPLCKNKITQKHIEYVILNSNDKIKNLKKEVMENANEREKVKEEIIKLNKKIDITQENIKKTELYIIKIKNIEEKKEFLKDFENDKKALAEEIETLSSSLQKTEKNLQDIGDVDEKYHNLKLEIEEISSRNENSLDTEIVYKERELERIRQIVKRSNRDLQELKQEIETLEIEIDEKTSILEKNTDAEQKLSAKFKKLFSEKSNLQEKIKEEEKEQIKQQQNLLLIDDSINNLKIERARFDAEYQALEIDFQPYQSVELLAFSMQQLEQKLEKTQKTLDTIGSINLRALEVYDQVKKQYNIVYSKVEQLEKEKQEILKIVEEIDRKKKKTFNKTLDSINELFTRNFSQLSVKGEAFLELENKEDPFSAGLNIIIKVGRGKYFNVTSLSGGEQTLVALSLIFAIQEFRPYCFYILDEIDAALDKRNSERLASLLKRYMQAGQYIIITHNDAIISESDMLYGVSMQEGVSKILSLEV